MAESSLKQAEAEIDLEALDEVFERYPRDTEDLIGLLREAQEACGYLAPEVLEAVADHAGLPWARVYGVASFYANFHLEPRGRHTIRVCRGTACHVRGGKQVLDAVRRELGVGEGETTDDLQFTLETVACLGTCSLAPVMMVDNAYYGKLTANRVRPIVDSYRADDIRADDIRREEQSQ
jgi:NADH-quinone oxidoreductase subunit E